MSISPTLLLLLASALAVIILAALLYNRLKTIKKSQTSWTGFDTVNGSVKWLLGIGIALFGLAAVDSYYTSKGSSVSGKVGVSSKAIDSLALLGGVAIIVVSGIVMQKTSNPQGLTKDDASYLYNTSTLALLAGGLFFGSSGYRLMKSSGDSASCGYDYASGGDYSYGYEF